MLPKNIRIQLHNKEKGIHFFDDIKTELPLDVISFRVRDLEHFYNPLDASPEKERELNSEIEQYCLKAVSKVILPSNVLVKIFVPENEMFNFQSIKESFKNFFMKRAEKQFHINKMENRRWIGNLLLGIAFLSCCLLTAKFLKQPMFDDRSIFSILRESLSIIGWVAVWEPVEYFLFHWHDNARILKNYMILHCSEVEIEEY